MFKLWVMDMDGNEDTLEFPTAEAALARFRGVCRNPNTDLATITTDDGFRRVAWYENRAEQQ